MTLYVFPTDEMREDAKVQGLSSEKVDKFCKEVEDAQSLATFSRFPPPYLTKKKIWSYNNRLIAAEHAVGDDLVIILLRLLIKSSREYENQFTQDAHSYASPLLEAAIPKAEEWLKIKNKDGTYSTLPKPTAEQQNFLWGEVGSIADDGVVVCETEQWVSSSQDPRIQDRLIFIPNLLIEISSNPGEGPQIAKSDSDALLQIAYFWNKNTQHLLLLDITYESKLDADMIFKGLFSDTSDCEKEDIARISRRSYPLIICCDSTLWIAIQRDETSNMALSFEETEILHSVCTTQSENGFPLFINGRAGSGKSTLLQYLFSDYFSSWVKHVWSINQELNTIPLYLAASEELLTAARSSVGGLLRANANRLLNQGSLSNDVLDLLDSAFQTPVKFLSKSLHESGVENKFISENHISYSRFRNLWFNRFARDRQALNELPPQLSWYIIRALIKGQSCDAEFEPEDFASLPRNEQIITYDIFCKAYERIWKNWYEKLCHDNDYWDDQDLANEVAKHKFQGSHSAVFCDEAQDFTRRELEALHRSCGFSFLQLTPEEAYRVPFVFAGDPFQTINPTGFRWEAVKAAFTEKIAGNLYRYKRRSVLPDINYRELTYNYRSGQNIVKLCNSIQAVRAIVMRETSLRPQKTWNLNNNKTLPVYFHTTESTTCEAIKGQKDLVFIVPCEEDGEIEYVNENETLRSLIHRDNNGVPQNVLSASRAKGLEFNRVAVVGFASAPEALLLVRCLANPSLVQEISIDELLPFEYFLNKLYVACSRPRKRLFILDHPNDLHNFWGFALDHDKLQEICSYITSAREEWSTNVGHIIKGLADHWRDDRNDPIETARRFEIDGKSKQDFYLLSQAALQYEQVGEEQKTNSCRAMAYEIQSKFEKAAQCYIKSGDLAKALECLWEIEAYQEIVNCAKNDVTLCSRVEYRLAVFLCNTKSELDDAIVLLNEIIRLGLETTSFKQKITKKGWNNAISRLLLRAEKSLKVADDQGKWLALSTIHEQLLNIGYVVDRIQQSQALYGAKLYNKVLVVLEGKQESDLYRRSKTIIIQNDHLNGDETKFTSDDLAIAADVLREDGKYNDALWCYKSAGYRQGLEVCLQDMIRSGSNDLINSYIIALMELASSQGDWGYILKILNGKDWHGLPKSDQNIIRDCVVKLDLLRKVVIESMACSDSLTKVKSDIRNQLMQHLKYYYPKITGGQQIFSDRELRLLGSAVERLGMDIDALEYYEIIFDNPAYSEDVRKYSERRWIQCKLRAEARERKLKRRASADRHKEQAESRLRTHAWSKGELGPTFPDKRLIEHGYASETSMQAKRGQEKESPQVERWEMNSLSCQYYIVSNRINLNSSIGQQARIDLRNKTVDSNDVMIKKSTENIWLIDAWGLSVEFCCQDGIVVLKSGDIVKSIRLF